jgi:hypothetical protein
LATPAEFRNKLQDQTKSSLEFYKQHNQLHDCYIVVEALQISNLVMTAEIKPGFNASIVAQKIKTTGTNSISIAASSDNAITINSSIPLLIGYKALSIDETFISDSVSKPPLDTGVLSPDQIEAIKQ